MSAVTDRTPTSQTLWRVGWASRSHAGYRYVWAPDRETARATLARYPSAFGLPCDPIIGTAIEAPLEEIEQELW